METSGEDSCVEESVDSQDAPRRFSAAQTATLKAYYSGGMVGTGQKYKYFIEKAASTSRVTTEQVKVCYSVKEGSNH